MPSPTAADLSTLIQFVRDLVDAASSESCSCSEEITEAQIMAALGETREMVRYERCTPVPTYAAGGAIAYTIHQFEKHLADNAQLLDAAYTPIAAQDISEADPFSGIWETTTSRLTVYLSGDRYDVYQAAADLLRALRARKRGQVDITESGFALKLSQALATMESVEDSYRRSARVRSITFGRSDIA